MMNESVQKWFTASVLVLAAWGLIDVVVTVADAIRGY